MITSYKCEFTTYEQPDRYKRTEENDRKTHIQVKVKEIHTQVKGRERIKINAKQ